GSPYRVRVLQVGHSTPGPGGTLRADGTVTLVWGGPVTALVDTGGPWDRPLLPGLLGEQGLSPEDVTHVVVTHGHSDHVGNVNLFPGATLLVGFDLSTARGVYLPHGLARGEPLELHPGHLQVVATPGHTRAHVALVVRGTAVGTVVVAGDTFERHGDEGQWEALSEDPLEQRRSRRWVGAVADVIVPGHGPPFRVCRDSRGGDTDGGDTHGGDTRGGGSEGRRD
ncbi:MBLC1 protein, partial [Formicarius rufipectus]|nr:MBLC1 protein [Formicarius rufipectus]